MLKTYSDVADYLGISVSALTKNRKLVPLEKVNGEFIDVDKWYDQVKLLQVNPREYREDDIDPEEDALLAGMETDEEVNAYKVRLLKAKMLEREHKANEAEQKVALSKLVVAEKQSKVMPVDDMTEALFAFAEFVKDGMTKSDAGLAKSVVGLTEVEALERIRGARIGVWEEASRGAWLGAKKSTGAFPALLTMVQDQLLTGDLGPGRKNT